MPDVISDTQGIDTYLSINLCRHWPPFSFVVWEGRYSDGLQYCQKHMKLNAIFSATHPAFTKK